jgi:phosphoribosylanthranilate isomerase
VARTRVKICGICRPEDAIAAASAGADAIGINLVPTAGRCVSLEDAGKIIAAATPLMATVGLFVNASADEIRRTLQTLPFSAVQLHGEEPPSLVADLKPIRVIKVIHLKSGDPALLQKWRDAIRDLELTNLIGLLVESARPAGQRGGTGVASDFAGFREFQNAGHFNHLPPIIVAGGLTPENVGDVVRLLRPYAVDVSSGVESVRRQKSTDKIDAFIKAVRQADGADHS